MKKINNLIKLMLVCGAFFFVSCETSNLDLTENPNALAPEQANPDFFMNAIQEDYARFIESFGRRGASMTRIDYMFGRDYQGVYSPAGFSGNWASAYQGMFQDIKVMNTLAEEANMAHHIGMGQVIQAHVLMSLVDFFGAIPYSESLLGSDNLNPVADSGESVYAAAIELLDAAIANFKAEASVDPQYDFFYNKDWDKWVKAANTLKMRAYMTTRLVDASAISKFNAIVSSGEYISSKADDFQFKWGTNEIQPDTRHPRYSSSYTSTGGGQYMSNFLMNYMRGENGYFNADHFDPRILFYFYRQTSGTPGTGTTPPDEETLECSLYEAPAHYEGFVYCGVPQGWWGRDHGNDNGIPPDGFKRALTGVYPAGGKLDDWTYRSQKNGGGNGGNGITPIMLSSWTDFMIAETKMVAGDDAGAKTAMLAGIDKSFDKVVNFAPLTERFIGITDYYWGGLDAMIAKFVGEITADWDAAASNNDKMNILAQQYFVAMYGNGADAYNFYRRTGYPTNLQPNIEPNPGAFIRSMFYPANYANTNSNATQKDGVTDQIFWDTNPPSPGFPVSN